MWLELLSNVAPFSRAGLRAVTPTRLGEPTRYNAELYRLSLTYERPQAGLPTSLIAKMPAQDPELAGRAEVFQPGARESWLYELARKEELEELPRCYYNAVDKSTGQSILLLQDLVPAQPARQEAGLTLAQARAALSALARLHARWWGDAGRPEIRQLQALLQPAFAAEEMLVQRLFDEAWPRFLSLELAALSPDVRHFGEAVVGNMARVDQMLARPQNTLAHGDFRADNLLFLAEAGALRCWIVDWEDCFWGSGALDVSWLLATGLRLADVANEAPLLRHYHQGLAKAGVSAYSFAECLLDYRYTLSNAFVQGILSATAQAEFDLEGAATLARRVVAAAERQRIVELLPGR